MSTFGSSRSGATRSCEFLLCEAHGDIGQAVHRLARLVGLADEALHTARVLPGLVSGPV